jgi:hypothetical protein
MLFSVTTLVGKSIMKVVPLPFSLVKSREPPIASTIHFVVASPRPNPLSECLSFVVKICHKFKE